MKYICAAFLIIAVPSHNMELKQKLVACPSQTQEKIQDNSGSFALLALGQPRISWISPAEVCLERQSSACAMSWLPCLYNVSGLSHCMSRECFMVNALAKIKEAITKEENRLAVLKVGAYVGGESLTENEPEKKCGLFTGNVFISGTALLATLLYWINAAATDISMAYPPSIRLTPVQTSCDRLYLVFNQTWGWDWYRECWDKSFEFNVPCNGTALGKGPTSFCCWAIVDPTCNKQIVDYMNNTYPALWAQADALHAKLLNQAKHAAAMPFYITASGVITLNLFFQLARYKYRRIMREKALPPTDFDEEAVSLETLNQE